MIAFSEFKNKMIIFVSMLEYNVIFNPFLHIIYCISYITFNIKVLNLIG